MPSVSKGKHKKLARIAALQNEKRTKQQQKDAASKRDLLEDYQAFRYFERSGISCELEGRHGEDLSEADVDACVALQKLNCGASQDFDETSSRAALRHPESRVLLMRLVPKSASDLTDPSKGDEATGADDDADEWDMLPEIAPPPKSAVALVEDVRPHTGVADEVASGGESILGYLHLQFCVADGPPLLCVLNMQLRSDVMGKGLGKFVLQLIEVCMRPCALPRIEWVLRTWLKLLKCPPPPGGFPCTL